MRHSLSWIAWLVFTMVLLLSTRNPVYLIIILLNLLIVGFVISRQKGLSNWISLNLRFVLTMIVLSSIINTLFTHTGRTIVLTLPPQWFLVGGDITVESLIFGMINGLVIGSLYITFNIINLSLGIKQITRLIPKVFRPIGMIATISLTFIPSIQQRAQEIKEAQMIRGNPMKKISDWLPLFIPLLVTSLENAFLLSESMTSRGFYSRKNAPPQEYTLIGIIIAVFTVFSGWILRLYSYPQIISIIFYFTGGIVLLSTLTIASRRLKVTRFNQETWTRSDILMTITLIALTCTWLILNLSQNITSFIYSPYPGIHQPEVQMTGVLLSTASLLPVLIRNHD